MLFGTVSLKWIAIVTILIDAISVNTANAGGHIAHLGGAAVGCLFAMMYKRGVDITNPFNKFVDKTVSLFSGRANNPFAKKHKFTKPKQNRKESTSATMNPTDVAEMDKILEKIKKSGYTSLTSDEKKKLFDVSKK